MTGLRRKPADAAATTGLLREQLETAAAAMTYPGNADLYICGV
ncbi:hypothetical protein [Actinoplanes awajinensis]|nr:hypothetical protein [Actinoplanes awajinensis]